MKTDIVPSQWFARPHTGLHIPGADSKCDATALRELRNDPELIAEYIRLYHPHGWLEINESIRAAGILDMQIYHLNARLFMIMDVSNDFSFEHKAELDRKNPVVQEWEMLMEKFQNVESGSEFGARWQLMEEIYSLT